MRGVIVRAAEWARAGLPFATATLVSIEGSSPRELGATMIVNADGQVFGNVSGGCVESALLVECESAIASGESSLHRFGIREDEVFSIGLTCGGTIEVLVRPVLPGGRAAQEILLASEHLAQGSPVSLALPVCGDLENSYLITEVRPRPDCETIEQGASTVLVVPLGSAPRLIIVGAVEYAVALAQLGGALGFSVTVVDPRGAFATEARFEGAEVVVEWPDRYLRRTAIDSQTAICVLSHDPRFDVPSLQIALSSRAGYVGAMGSRRTHEDRIQRLNEAGLSAASIARLRSPIGLDLGGRTPQETALSILAEIVSVRHGGSGAPLSRRDGPVHGGSVQSSDERSSPAHSTDRVG